MRHRLSWIPLLILLLSLLITGVATFYVAKTIAARDQLRFQNEIDTIQDHIVGRLNTYIALLHATRGLFAADQEVSRDGFRRFVDELGLREQFPGIQGIGYSVRVPASSREELAEVMKGQGVSDFHIWPNYPGEESHAIIYLEPLDRRNAAAIGYDMSSSEVRREAMEKARDTGVAAMSGKVTLVQEIDEQKQPGFLIYLPVYRGEESPGTLHARREQLAGFVYGPFRAEDLLRGFAGYGDARFIRYEVYDGAMLTPENLLYSTGTGRTKAPENAPDLATDVQIAVARRTWTVRFRALPEFQGRSDRQLIPLTVAGGLLASTLLFFVTYSQAMARKTAEDTAGELRISRREAETANRLKDQFLATVSHELRTPLNAITGWTHLLLAGNPADEETRKGLEIIERNARSQAQLIDDLLERLADYLGENAA